MARTEIIKNTKMMMLTKPFSVHGLAVGRRRNCTMSKSSVRDNHRFSPDEISEVEAVPAGGERTENTARWWMPHPRTGIYFPAGQEWVMDGIPNDAASFDCTFWLRSVDGVDDHNYGHHYRK